MPADLYVLARWVHIGGGFAAVGLGPAVMLVPKFGRRAAWHRRLGRVYAGVLATSAAVGVPLSYLRESTYLMVLGAFTLAVIGLAWRDALAAGTARRRGDGAAAERHLRWHLILMGASYVGAWSGFFANNFVFGADAAWKVHFYVFGPSAVGAVFIARAAVRLAVPATTVLAAPRADGVRS